MSVVTPRIFLLNNGHELSPLKTSGGGRRVEYKVDWPSRGKALRDSLRSALAAPGLRVDPTGTRHHFLAAHPDASLQFEGKAAGEPTLKTKEVDFGGRESRLFRRLGMDLVGTADGVAIVHLSDENRARIDNELAEPQAIGRQRRNDLSMIESFGVVPLAARFSQAWLDDASGGPRVDLVLELMPVLRGAEVDEVLHGIRKFLPGLDPEARWKRLGRDFSRRAWLRLELRRDAIKPLLEAFPSIQHAHPPIFFEAAAAPERRRRTAGRAAAPLGQPPARTVSRPPVVAIVDMGVVVDHSVFSTERAALGGRPIIGGRYGHPSGGAGARGHHGSMVASRVAFPPQDDDPAGTPLGALCRVVDINATDPEEDLIDAKAILPMMQTAMDANPEVRVFNLSCRMRGASLTTLADGESVRYGEALRATADFDNFAHRNDALVVIAVGNAPEGAVPIAPYPGHLEDPNWHLCAPAFAANAVTVGATVGTHVSPDTVVTEPHRPSPFSRVGVSPLPGIKPDLCAVGGNQRVDGVESPWAGVPVLDQSGEWVRSAGTSFAAPVVAREAAFLWRRLRDIGRGLVEPYAVTVKACLALSGRRGGDERGIEALAKVALGFGYPEIDPWFEPPADRGLLVWQGMLKGPNLKSRVRFPIPGEWLAAAKAPRLRVCWCWDPPVNPAVPEVWICRDVTLRLRAAADDGAPALSGSRSTRGRTPYPLRFRDFVLDGPRLEEQGISAPADGIWILEVSYLEIADLPDLPLSTYQRVAVAAELVDLEGGVGPQEALQAMPIAQSMTHFSVETVTDVKVGAG